MACRTQVSCWAVVLVAALPLAQQSVVPADLDIVLASSPRPAADGQGAEAVQISASGVVVFSAKEIDGGSLPVEEATLSAAAITEIWAVIEQQSFFELDEVYVDTEVSGGDLAVLEITANGVTHGVMTVNIGVDAFDAIVWAINDHLPDERQVIYNALHVEGYQRVAR